jgi:hypothetical protein
MLGKFSIVLMVAAVLAPAAVLADNPDGQPTEPGGFYFGLDEMRLRRDIVDIRYYYTRPVRVNLEADDLHEGFVYFGAGSATGIAGQRMPVAKVSPGVTGSNIPPDRLQDIGLWVDWRPDVTGDYFGADLRQIGRSLAGSEIDRVGVRADVTALLFDDSGVGTTAWRVSGALGSTSLSLVSGDPAVAGAIERGGGLLWDVGVGWSSGSVSLNAGYQSASSLVESGNDIAVLSLGADYAIFPGLSVYGELNVIDDPATLGDERLGTVFILGTGLNF